MAKLTIKIYINIYLKSRHSTLRKPRRDNKIKIQIRKRISKSEKEFQNKKENFRNRKKNFKFRKRF